MAGGETPALFSEAIVLLSGAVIAAPLFKKFGLGTVLGYLAAGVVVGPILRLITDAEAVLQVSELGIVFLLFIIGLELKPSRLWSLRRDIFGLGMAQVVISGLILMGLTIFIGGQSFAPAAVIGFGLALSSTAFALQILEERGETNLPHGQRTFSILLFQDIAIVPLLAVVPLLAPFVVEQSSSGLHKFMAALLAVLVLIAAGRFVLKPLFRLVGSSGAHEAMIATALLIVLGSAYLMQIAGLSMAMGAFIAGVMLADSPYRHELEANIEPFRGLLLGLFFMAIGMSLDLGVLSQNWLLILLCVPALLAIKAIIIYVLCRMFGSNHNMSIRIATILPQGGEFGFVLFSAGVSSQILSAETSSLLIVIVTLSMAFTPLMALIGKQFESSDASAEMEEDFEGADENVDVLMIGFSRFGQIASQTLLAGGVDVTIIDYSTDRVQSAGNFGFKIYFGDGTRKDVLEAAGIRRARVVAVCTNNRKITDKIVALISQQYPDIRLFVRSYDRSHALSLRAQGVEYELRETFESGLTFGGKTLEALGLTEESAHEILDDVRKRDADRLRIQESEGMMAGRDMLHTKPVKPEPLTRPQKEGRIVNIDNKTHESGANG